MTDKTMAGRIQWMDALKLFAIFFVLWIRGVQFHRRTVDIAGRIGFEHRNNLHFSFVRMGFVAAAGITVSHESKRHQEKIKTFFRFGQKCNPNRVQQKA